MFRVIFVVSSSLGIEFKMSRLQYKTCRLNTLLDLDRDKMSLALNKKSDRLVPKSLFAHDND